MKIEVASRRKKRETLHREYPHMEIIDVTSKGDQPWVKFSPFYPHGNIPVPFSTHKSQSVEGLWQALKVFETTDVDLSKMEVINMKNIKRTVRKNGKVLGHRKGTTGEELLGYLDARKLIYIPSYTWVLENCLENELNMISNKAEKGVVLLDYETNGDVNNLSKPLSHAYLIKHYLESHIFTSGSN